MTNLNISSPKLQRVILEFTTRCNLRCSYCEKSQPDAITGSDMPPDILDRIISFLIEQKTGFVCVNGNGETTFFRDWDLYCDRLLDNGCKLGIITNFSKIFTDKELHTLSRFSCIEISCDTADPDLFRQLRSGAELSTIIDNMKRLAAKAYSLKLPMPQLSWSCVLSDQNVFKLEDYFILGVENGIRNFTICNLLKHPDIEGVLSVNHITELPQKKFLEAVELLNTLTKLLQENKISVHMPTALVETITRKYKDIEDGEQKGIFKLSDDIFYSSERLPNSTRDCTEPWYSLFFHSDKSVSPCSVIDKSVTFDQYPSPIRIMDSPELKALRDSLFNGELISHCEHCPVAGWTQIDNFQTKVLNSFGSGNSPAP